MRSAAAKHNRLARRPAVARPATRGGSQTMGVPGQELQTPAGQRASRRRSATPTCALSTRFRHTSGWRTRSRSPTWSRPRGSEHPVSLLGKMLGLRSATRRKSTLRPTQRWSATRVIEEGRRAMQFLRNPPSRKPAGTFAGSHSGSLKEIQVKTGPDRKLARRTEFR